MAKESLEALNSNEYQVEYTLPSFWHRVLANFMDLIIFALLFVGVFILTNRIVSATPGYKKENEIVDKVREDSGLFVYESSRKTYELITTYFENTSEIEYPTRVIRSKKAISDFLVYVQDGETSGACEVGTYDEIVVDYNKSRLDVLYENNHLFVIDTDTNTIINNPNVSYNAEVYYKNFYKPYIQQIANGYLITSFPAYYNSLKQMSNYLIFCELPISLTVSAIVTYFVPTLIFRRGRATFGKKFLHIGLVNDKCLNLSFGRNLARFAIFFLGEMVLSIFTFGIPLIFSFTMMCVTKKKQGFPDFMLKCTEIDNSKAKIYKSQYEALEDFYNIHKKPVDFKLEERE